MVNTQPLGSIAHPQPATIYFDALARDRKAQPDTAGICVALLEGQKEFVRDSRLARPPQWSSTSIHTRSSFARRSTEHGCRRG